MVVHSEDGLDEISLAASTQVAELKEGEITQYTVSPEAFGIERQSLATLKAANAEDSLRLVKAALSGEGPASDMVALNAGAALYCAGVADSLKEGVLIAQDAQGSKLPLEKLRAFTLHQRFQRVSDRYEPTGNTHYFDANSCPQG